MDIFGHGRFLGSAVLSRIDGPRLHATGVEDLTIDPDSRAGPSAERSGEGARRSTRRLRNKAITCEYLLTLAGAVFDLTLRRIAARARVSVGTISGHFPDKASLWRAAMGVDPPVGGLATGRCGPKSPADCHDLCGSFARPYSGLSFTLDGAAPATGPLRS